MTDKINCSDNTQMSPKRRVLFVITQSEMGGAQRFLCNLLSRLNKSHYEILVAVGADGDGEIFKFTGSLGIKTSELARLKRDISPLNDLRAVFEIRDMIRKFKPDTIFLNSSKTGFVGSLATALLRYHTTRPKVIYRIGGWTFNDPWPKWKKRLWIIFEEISARWKDVIVVNNKHDLEQAKTLKIKPRENIILIHNGLDMYKLDFVPKEARLKLFEKAAKQSGRIFNAGIIIGTIANFYPPKGLKYLIEAAEHFKNRDDIVFIIIGDGQERPELENLIEQKCLQKKVLLLGQISDAYKYLPAFDIFVLPSVKEGFPWVILEAMAAKLPVIATNVGAVPEIIEDGKNGFIVEPGRPEQIAGKIQELLNNEHLWQEIGIQAHQTVLFKFPLEKMVKETEALL